MLFLVFVYNKEALINNGSAQNKFQVHVLAARAGVKYILSNTNTNTNTNTFFLGVSNTNTNTPMKI